MVIVYTFIIYETRQTIDGLLIFCPFNYSCSFVDLGFHLVSQIEFIHYKLHRIRYVRHPEIIKYFRFFPPLLHNRLIPQNNLSSELIGTDSWNAIKLCCKWEIKVDDFSRTASLFKSRLTSCSRVKYHVIPEALRRTVFQVKLRLTCFRPNWT